MSRRAKRRRLSALQRDVLWLLDETGEETLTTVMNTLHRSFVETEAGELLCQCQEAVLGLYRLGFVSIGREYGDLGRWSVPVTDAEVQQRFTLAEVRGWDADEGCFRWNGAQGGSHPFTLVLTTHGRAALTA